MFRRLDILRLIVGACVLLVVFAVVGTVFFASVGTRQETSSNMQKSTLSLGVGVITVDVARTDAELVRGLSERTRLGDQEGMLFVFEKDSRQGIWMKDMNFPIDIIWLDSQKRVVHIVRDASPESYPVVFTPPVDARYVLEVPAGSVARWGVNVGGVVRF